MKSKTKIRSAAVGANVAMRERAKRQAGEPNTFENISRDRGVNTQQLKEAENSTKKRTCLKAYAV